MKYTVSVITEVAYDVEVEAETFDEAAQNACDHVTQVSNIEGEIRCAAEGVVPAGVLNYIESRVNGVYRN
jgi:hypothetical protein